MSKKVKKESKSKTVDVFVVRLKSHSSPEKPQQRSSFGNRLQSVFLPSGGKKNSDD